VTLYHYLTYFGKSSRDSVITQLTSVNQAVTLYHYLTYFGKSSRDCVSLLNILRSIKPWLCIIT